MATESIDPALLKDADVIQYINVKLAALGQPVNTSTTDASFIQLASPLLNNLREKDRLLAHHLCPVDQRIQTFLDETLPGPVPRLPSNSLVLDLAGLGRKLSLPPDGNIFSSPFVTSYRLKQGILHNPKSDRRTTQGVFHIVEGGLPIPDDKIVVPKSVFAKILQTALVPPDDLMVLPFTANQTQQARMFVSLLLRPLVCPAVPPLTPERRMEIRFFVPGSLVGNLDFVEGIFGNGGDPYLPSNDAALDIDHWTGHTGCVILAPHLTQLKKKDVGLPRYELASERQKRDGMCWKKEDELYNEGQGFKITCRDEKGVIVTVIADNYFGYCKKEVKTQIGYAANLFGLCEEEHSGGAIAFSSAILGQTFYGGSSALIKEGKFLDVVNLLGDSIDVKPEGYAVDKTYPTIFYVPENATFHVRQGTVSWKQQDRDVSIRLLANHVYVLPGGYKVRLEKQIGGTSWRLVGSMAEGTLCHKPCTVSGGGKSEISKSIRNAMLQAPVFVKEFQRDLDEVAAILKNDFSSCYRVPSQDSNHKRPLLSVERSLGSVVKLFTPSTDYTDEHNLWIRSLPQTIRQLVFVVKRYYRPEWGDQWRQHFSVDRINGYMGHELKYDDHKLIANYLRVGFDPDGSWRIHKVRPDFNPADKVQVEDDITASAVFPSSALKDLNKDYKNPSVKIVANCEELLFQRPDDAIIRGFDLQAEADIASPHTFLSNFEPLNQKQTEELVNHIVDFDQYTAPMKELLEGFVKNPVEGYVVSSAHPRMVDGKPSKNPRYLQRRPDLVNARETYLANMGARLSRQVPLSHPLYFPVNAVLAGRRNNPPDKKAGIPPSAVYNPIHFQELPELFMDFVCSLTGKSPSTTGFGSEGALTKGPFNALLPVIDVNNALVSFILTGYAGFTTAAGYVGPHYRVDHDVSLLIPELWCRIKVKEREPAYLIQHGYLEKVNDFAHKGKQVLASRLGYRINSRFVDRYLGRIFEAPNMVFTDEMLAPEKQDMDIFAEGVDSIIAAQKLVAERYFADGSVAFACPPLKALLHIMAKGHYEGKDVTHPDIRSLFSRELLLSSDWYKTRLKNKQKIDVALWERHLKSIQKACADFSDSVVSSDLQLPRRLIDAQTMVEACKKTDYREKLIGTIGADL